MKNKLLVIIGFGPVAGYKYSRCIRKAIESGHIIGYVVVDLASQSDNVHSRLAKLPLQPLEVLLLDDAGFHNNPDSGMQEFHQYCESLKIKYGHELKVVISTEPQAHEQYLKYCIENEIDALVTKPITLPMHNGLLDSSNIYNSYNKLISTIPKNRQEQYAAICLTRHHEIYNEGVIKNIISKMKTLQAPVTSIRLNTNSGVWNLNNEFQERNDHPYKFGYGMLFHGGYHYIDLVAQTIMLNKLIYPQDNFYVELSTYTAFPTNQKYRIPNEIVKKLTGYYTKDMYNLQNGNYGETDLVTSFAVKSEQADDTLLLGTLSLEQTTPGMRSWFDFPEVPYNINGRLHCTDFLAQISTLFSAQGRVVKVPIGARKSENDLRGKNLGKLYLRSNAAIVGDQEFYQEKDIIRAYGNSFSYAAETEIFMRWVTNQPTHSNLHSHQASVAFLEALALSSKKDGEKIRFAFNYSPPEYLESINDQNITYNDSSDVIFSAYK